MKRRKTRLQKIKRKAKVANNLLIAQSKSIASLQLQVDKLTEELEIVKCVNSKRISSIDNTLSINIRRFKELDQDLNALACVLSSHTDRFDDLDVIVRAQNFTLLKHDREIPDVRKSCLKLCDTAIASCEAVIQHTKPQCTASSNFRKNITNWLAKKAGCR